MEEILLKVKKIIASLNVTLEDNADIQLELIYDYELEKLLNYLNRNDLPKGLKNTLVYRIVASFLLNAMTLGKYANLKSLTTEDLMSVINIKEYETSISYAKNEIVINDLTTLKKTLEDLKEYNSSELHRYRLIQW